MVYYWRRISNRSVLRRLIAGCCLTATAVSSAAQPENTPVQPEAGAFRAGDIIVTARKRAESIQDVPVSITAFDAAAIERNNITSIDKIAQYSPNVMLVPISIAPTALAATIRGIGNFNQEPSQDPPIAISIDGVYIAQVSGSLLGVFDAEQVEVLRGPQGTLQGRNSPGGAINVTSRRPGDTLAMRLDGSYGNYNDVQIKGAIDVPIVEGKVAAKAAVFYENHDGYSRNITTGERLSEKDSRAARLGLLLTPNEDLSIYLTADYTRDKSSQPGLRYMGITPELNPLACTVHGFCQPNPKRTSTLNYTVPNDLESYGFSSNIDWSFSNMTLTSITGYRYSDEHQYADVDATPFDIFHQEDRNVTAKQWSQELRLASDNMGPSVAGNLDWVVGLYYLHSTFDMSALQHLLGGAPRFSARDQKLDSYAIFGQASFYITDAWSISAGGRQSWDDKSLTATPVNSPSGTFEASFDNLSLDAGTELRLTRDAMVFARFAQGYRSGGINGAASNLAAVTPYEPEKVNAYELGVRSEWLDRRLTLNITGFWMDYTNLQRNVIHTDANDNVLVTIGNQGKARMKGVEVDLVVRPTDNIGVSVSYGYLDAKYIDEDFRDLDVMYAPNHQINVGFDWTIPLPNDDKILVAGNLSMKSEYNVNSDTLSIGRQGSHALADGSITYSLADDRYSIGVYGKNIFNNYYKQFAVDTGGFSNWILEGPPRTYGVRVTARF